MTDIDMIDELFEDRPRILPEERDQFRQALKSEGMKTGIVLCTVADRPGKYFILDGYKRYIEAGKLGIPLKIDTERTVHFENVRAAILFGYKLFASKGNLSDEQRDLLLARYYHCFLDHYLENEKLNAANQEEGCVKDRTDPEFTVAESVAMEFGESPARVNRAAEKAELIDSLELHVPIMQGRIRSVSKRTLEAFVQAKADDPEKGFEILQAALHAADANGGRMLPPEKTVEDDPELEVEEPYDPEAERALDERSKMIEWLIRKAREEWDECYVERLERKVLEAFTTWLEKPQVIPATEC